jgi:hypothetical protein
MRLRMAGLVVCLIAGGTAIQSQKGKPDTNVGAPSYLRTQVGGRDLALDPPRIAETIVEPLPQPTPQGNTLLRVRFADDEALPSRLDYLADAQVITLADDGAWPDQQGGDKVYTAVGPVDLNRFRQDIATLASSSTAQPVGSFRSRSRTATGTVLDPSTLQKGGMVWEPWGDPATVDAERSLLVRDPSVVGDPARTRVGCSGGSMGPWSFGYLMDEAAIGRSADTDDVEAATGARMARLWLESFDADSGPWPDGRIVARRPGVRAQLLDPWIAASGGPGRPLDLSRAPFQLLAIVNRIDLRGALGYGGPESGELRFVFTAVSPSCEPLPFTVIFEFSVTEPGVRNGCFAAQAWARDWKALEAYPVGSTAYRDALEALTERIVRHGHGAQPNDSNLHRLRTNENAFGPPGAALDWEMRQFELRASGETFTDHLTTVAVTRTPAAERNHTGALVTYVQEHAAEIREDRHVVPDRLPAPLLAGGSSRYRFGWFWDGKTPAALADRESRHRFSLATCSGCHAGETGTDAGHVAPGLPGFPARLSGFLTGIDVADPADGVPTRHFSDLERRATDLSAFIATPCFLMPADTVVRATH